jgi:tryptophan halogenase
MNVARSLAYVGPGTVVESGEFGWCWQIDTFENRDLGYVYASEFVDDDAALAEFLEHVDEPVEEDDVVNYEFSSGYYDPAWTGNCLGEAFA